MKEDNMLRYVRIFTHCLGQTTYGLVISPPKYYTESFFTIDSNDLAYYLKYVSCQIMDKIIRDGGFFLSSVSLGCVTNNRFINVREYIPIEINGRQLIVS